MSNFSSFYGGRQGASFIIVKRFDGIDIPDKSAYKITYYAVNENKIIKYPFIEKNEKNYYLYNWATVSLDGSDVEVVLEDGTYSTETLDIVYQEGMRQCFEKGGDSVDQVNYGEYVIIDCPSKNNPDNGKIFRRGMNFDYDPVTNPYAGGEYIGQVVGPQGETPEMDVDSYDDILNSYPAAIKKEYTATDGDLVPGSYIENGIRKFNNTIKYIYSKVVDEYGNIHGCVIGFKTPTLVDDFEARSLSPYEQRAVGPDGKYYNYDLIQEDDSEYVDGKWKHPYYQKWQIKVPHGYHGINSTNVEIIHTKTMPAGFKEGFAGATLYYDAQCTDPYDEGYGPVVLRNSINLLRGSDYDARESVISAIVEYNGQRLYVKKEDCYMDIVRYRETNFDNLEQGEVQYFEIGDYNIIERITISENGILTVYYSAEPDPVPLTGATLRWIDTVDSDGITVDDEGTLTIYYNTLHDDGTGTMIHDKQEYPHVIKWINDVDIQTADGSGIEGSGDQKVRITYNIPDEIDPTKKEVKVIDDALNYIIESKISIPTTAYPNVPYWHLLVYYSDPELRSRLSDKWVTYPSDKYPGTIWTEWVDLGSVKGELAGIHVLKNVTDMNELKDGSGNWIPPERLPASDGSGTILNPEGQGWSCTLQESGTNVTTYLFYDYDQKLWYKGTSVDPSAVDPSYIVAKSAPNPNQEPYTGDVDNLKENGFWFAVEKGVAVK